MERKKNKTALLGIAVALLLPLSFYVIAKVMGKDKLDMPSYYSGDQKIEPHKAMKEVKAGALKPAADLEAFNQFGDIVRLNHDLPGKMLVVNFFFTTCKTVCPNSRKTLSGWNMPFARRR